ncbi:hypothetical protein EMIT0P44_10199 [Pseudomonas sp. IT-P44]
MLALKWCLHRLKVLIIHPQKLRGSLLMVLGDPEFHLIKGGGMKFAAAYFPCNGSPGSELLLNGTKTQTHMET